MPETDEDNRSNNLFIKSPPEELPVMMTMDLDLDGSWTFDQIFSSDPSPPLILSATEQSFSTLWAFSDDNNNISINSNDDVIDGADNRLAGNITLTSAGAGQRLLSGWFLIWFSLWYYGFSLEIDFCDYMDLGRVGSGRSV